MKLDQSKMPIYEALQQMKREFLGEKCMFIDVN